MLYCWFNYSTFSTLAPLYKTTLLKLVLLGMFTYTGLDVCSFLDIRENIRVVPFILAHPSAPAGSAKRQQWRLDWRQTWSSFVSIRERERRAIPCLCWARSFYCPRITVVELSPLPFLSVVKSWISQALAIETYSLIFVLRLMLTY